MTQRALRKPSLRMLAAVAVGSTVILGGFTWVMAGLTSPSASVASSSAGQTLMGLVSSRLGTDRQWKAEGDKASLVFGQAAYTINGAKGEAPYLVIDIAAAAPDVRPTAAGRAADVALSLANASNHQVDRLEIARSLEAQAQDDLRIINGFEIHVAGDALTVRPPL